MQQNEKIAQEIAAKIAIVNGPIKRFMYKIGNHDLPSCLENMFTISDNNNYNLRSNETNFTLPKSNTKSLKKSISYSGNSGVVHWNALLMRAKKSQISIDQFKGPGTCKAQAFWHPCVEKQDKSRTRILGKVGIK
jgi:hypothetical protein